ncbi:MAG: ATP-binding cassette domain-containing protein [Desulfarculaceae bacterium]|jgi:peptide/nickel transport system ATP-binding protein
MTHDPSAQKAEHQAVVELDQVSKIFKTRGNIFDKGAKQIAALDEVDLSIGRGEIFGLVGESGSGKTTAGRIIVGLETPSSGVVRVEGHNISNLEGKDLRLYRRKVQMVFQDPYQSLNPQMSIMDSVAEPLITNKIANGSQREAMITDTFKEVGLTPPEDFLFRFPHQLSGGQRQRVAIARAMVLKPSCLVADEPTSMLDASYSAQIFEILHRVRDDYGTTILFITHSLASARYLCDNIAVIYRGRLMERGPAHEVIGHPAHPYTQALLDATPKFGRCQDMPRFGTLLARERKTTGQGCLFYHRCRKGKEDLCAIKPPDWHLLGDAHEAACHFAENLGRDIPGGQECRLGV